LSIPISRLRRLRDQAALRNPTRPPWRRRFWRHRLPAVERIGPAGLEGIEMACKVARVSGGHFQDDGFGFSISKLSEAGFLHLPGEAHWD